MAFSFNTTPVFVPFGTAPVSAVGIFAVGYSWDVEIEGTGDDVWFGFVGDDASEVLVVVS